MLRCNEISFFVLLLVNQPRSPHRRTAEYALQKITTRLVSLKSSRFCSCSSVFNQENESVDHERLLQKQFGTPVSLCEPSSTIATQSVTRTEADRDWKQRNQTMARLAILMRCVVAKHENMRPAHHLRLSMPRSTLCVYRQRVL